MEWDRARTARSYLKMTGDSSRVLPEMLTLTSSNPAGIAAIEALGWLGHAAEPVGPQLGDWLSQDSRLGTSGTIGDAVERDETFRMTAQTTLTAISTSP